MLKITNKGIQILVEDWPGRIGYLGKGMAPAGAMDSLAPRLGNLIVGNPIGEATIEIVAGYLTAEFETDTVIAITGGGTKSLINNQPVPMWEAIRVKKGDVLKLAGCTQDGGFRTYLVVAGGIDVPIYLGSKSTCLFGSYGGFEGRALNTGDILKICKTSKDLSALEGKRLKKEFIPEYGHTYNLRAIVGPNACPDYTTEEGMDYIFNHVFKVNLNSNRSAVRLDTVPDYFFARKDGGEGGSHSSNIIDHGYAMPGALNITGNTPIILAVDGPSLGGYIVCLKIIGADLWKMGQVVPGKDSVTFNKVDKESALEALNKRGELFSDTNLLK